MRLFEILAAAAAALSLSLALLMLAVWWGDRSIRLEYRERVRLATKEDVARFKAWRDKCAAADAARVSGPRETEARVGTVAPVLRSAGTPVHGVRLDGPYRRPR